MTPLSRPVVLGGHDGEVVEFDDPRGLGVVRTDDGAELAFHCTAIRDGSRTISVGSPVAFRVVPGRLGRWEATELQPRVAEG